ncbi:hypothetical protein POM88_011119 [Heracleum sosnowskyi]|uniref:Uncharacterized protein n=1 Tax=Heracleum sosnowskyi TaxID=360622 RepID=A0AAD8IVP6_9APIA|nr:hypothetical protein POM88_011119 [Heracleum sosnowskyi]
MDPRIEKHMRRLRDEFTEDIEYEASKRQSNYFGDESVEKLVRSTDDLEVLTTLYTVDEDSNFQQVFLKKPTRERHMRSVCVVFPASMTFRSIFDVFKEAGLKVTKYWLPKNELKRTFSVQFGSSSLKV